MTGSNKKYVFLLDGNAPWVRSLFSKLPGVMSGEQVVRSLQVHTLSYWICNRRSLPKESEGADGIFDRRVLIPGWRYTARCSEKLLQYVVSRSIGEFGPPEAIIYTLPHYAGIAAKFRDLLQVYYAHDPFALFPGWNRARMEALEKRMLISCKCAFAVSRQLAEDLRVCSHTPVYYSPNAVSSSFLRALHTREVLTPPEDLSHVQGKIVGCIGQLHPSAYDWNLIRALAQSFPETTFVFVGTKMASDSASTAKMEETLQLRNLRWLGPKPHNELPRYLKRFDICLNPLAVSEYNHRRSLLRLYDYIATSSPILSTALKEALELGDLVEVVRDTEDCISKLRRLLKMRAQVDCESRKISMQKHTWEVRARDLWENVLRTAEHERRIPASSL